MFVKFAKTISLWCALLVVTTSCSHTTSSEHVHQTKTTVERKPVRKQLMPIVVIDPGHGAYDLGAHTPHCEEKDLCLKTGHFVRKYLEQRGYHVIMTRTRDEYIPLKKRASLANRAKSQVMVSIHFNAAKNSAAHGIEIYYYPKGEPWRKQHSKRLAQTILSKMLAATQAQSRGVKEGNFCVIRETHMPAILIEGGFITNEEESRKMRSERYLDYLGRAIADGLEQYFADCFRIGYSHLTSK